jgi:hypothetical protein
LINADRIHEEWQNLKVGDPMKMCPGTSGPPPYIISIIEPNHAIVMGHKENGNWTDIWQFIVVPQSDGTTRLVIRSRNALQGWFWDAMRPGEFIMMRGMMLGIKERAEKFGAAGSIVLEGVDLNIIGTGFNPSFPANCTGGAPVCYKAKDGYTFFSITLEPQNLPEGDMLAYKMLPKISLTIDGHETALPTVQTYENATDRLTLGFEVPEIANSFALQWADLYAIPLGLDAG